MAEAPAKRYLIPTPIRRGYEVFSGWGLIEVAVALAGFLAGSIWFLLGGLVGLSVALRLVGFVALLAIGAFLALPTPQGDPLYRRIVAGWQFTHAPHRYRYDWGRSDWDD